MGLHVSYSSFSSIFSKLGVLKTRGGSRANLKEAVDNRGVFSSTEISKVRSSKGAQNFHKVAPDLFQFGEGS